MSDRVKVSCKRCAGSGTVVHRTAKADARCYCCGGVGHYFRAAPKKRVSAEERNRLQLEADNARLRELFPHRYDADGKVIR